MESKISQVPESRNSESTSRTRDNISYGLRYQDRPVKMVKKCDATLKL